MRLMTTDRLCGHSPSSGCDEHEGELGGWKGLEGNQSLQKSLGEVMALVAPIINSTLDDADIAHVMLTNNLFAEPLSWHEYTVLGCALYQERRVNGEGLDYGSVVELTDRFQGKPMNTTMIYKTVAVLEKKGLIACIGKDKSARGRVADHFVVTRNGKAAFRLATTNALHLTNSRESVAA